MGVIDIFEPHPSLECPWCGDLVEHWQGNGGPRALFVWRQGEKHPVRQAVDEPIASERFSEFTLSDEFNLIGRCPSEHVVRGIGRCHHGVWDETDTSEAKRAAADDAERRRVRALRESWVKPSGDKRTPNI